MRIKVDTKTGNSVVTLDVSERRQLANAVGIINQLSLHDRSLDGLSKTLDAIAKRIGEDGRYTPVSGLDSEPASDGGRGGIA